MRHDPNYGWFDPDTYGTNVRFWRVDGSDRAVINIYEVGEWPHRRLKFCFGPGPFSATLPGLEALRKIDDATDGYLMTELERIEGDGAEWLREMIHRDRRKPDEVLS